MLIAVDYEVFTVRLIMITSYRSSLSEIRSFESTKTNTSTASPNRAPGGVCCANTDPTAVHGSMEVLNMDVIDVPADFNPVSIIAGGK